MAKKRDVSTNEIMEFLQENMVMREEYTEDLGSIRKDLNSVKTDLNSVKTDLNSVKTDLNSVKTDLNSVRKESKENLNKLKLEILDAMDEKLADLKGDLVVMMRKEDRKVSALIELLKEKKVLSKEEAGVLLDFRPFPQSV